MYSEFLIKLTDCVKEIQNDSLMEIIETTKLKLNEKQKCNIGIVSDFYGRKAVFKLLKQYGIDDSDYIDYIPDNDLPFVIEVKYGDDNQEVTAVDEFIKGIKYLKITVETRQETFKDFSITFICGVNMNSIDESLLHKCSYLFLLTNATMAMPLSAKTWVQEIIVPKFGSDRLTICLYNTNLLNTEEDIKAIENNINKMIEKGNWQCTYIPSDEILSDKIAEVISESEMLEKKRIGQIVKNCIDELKCSAYKLLDAKQFDIEDLRKMVERLDNERKEIEISGKIAVGNVVNNLFTDLKYQIVNAADEYIDDAYRNIHNRISTTDSVVADIKHIPTYLEKVCELFEKKASEKIFKEYEIISFDLANLIENDCERIISLVQVPGFENFLPEINVYEKILSDRFSYSNFSSNEIDKKAKSNKTFSKGMIVASVALAFIDPVLGISTLIGSRIYNNYRTKETENEARKTVLDGLLDECSALKKSIVTQITNELEHTQQMVTDNLEKVYDEIIKSLIETICAAVDQIEKAKKEFELISNFLNSEICIIEKSM